MGSTPWSEGLMGETRSHLVTRQDTVTEGVSWVNHEDSEPEDMKRSECGVGLGEELTSGHVGSLARQGPMGPPCMRGCCRWLGAGSGVVWVVF